MLEGLEISVLKLSETILDNEKFRLDSEFFLKKYLRSYAIIKKNEHDTLGYVVRTLTDYHANGSYEILNNNVTILDTPDFAYMVRSTDLENNNYSTDVKYVDEHAYHFLEKSKLYGNELLINKIGSPGRVYLMPSINKPMTLGMNLFLIRLKKETSYSTKFLWAFFQSELGKNIIQRKINGTVPLTIDKEAIRTLYIPHLRQSFQEKIDKIIDLSFLNDKRHKSIYLQSEQLLLKELGLKNWRPSTEKINKKSFKESFLSTGRLDAEYYQPKYEELLNHLKQFETKHLGSIVDIKKSIEPGSEAYQNEGIPFIRVANITKFGITDTDIHLDRKEYQNYELKPKKDTILLSKDGSVGIAYKVEEDLDIITSSALLHLNIVDKEYLPDYLTLVLNSIVVKLQSERDAGGSIIQHWKPSEIEQVVIPKLSNEIQQQITGKIQESFKLKRESEYLLDVAKRAVEIAIEQNEDAAIKYINQNQVMN